MSVFPVINCEFTVFKSEAIMDTCFIHVCLTWMYLAMPYNYRGIV